MSYEQLLGQDTQLPGVGKPLVLLLTFRPALLLTQDQPMLRKAHPFREGQHLVQALATFTPEHHVQGDMPVQEMPLVPQVQQHQ